MMEYIYIYIIFLPIPGASNRKRMGELVAQEKKRDWIGSNIWTCSSRAVQIALFCWWWISPSSLATCRRGAGAL
jgi:hypothetical protein